MHVHHVGMADETTSPLAEGLRVSSPQDNLLAFDSSILTLCGVQQLLFSSQLCSQQCTQPDGKLQARGMQLSVIVSHCGGLTPAAMVSLAEHDAPVNCQLLQRASCVMARLAFKRTRHCYCCSNDLQGLLASCG